jgi:catechol 2,3-dioxygenase-like lactoylglutathione lyase family enzyme
MSKTIAKFDHMAMPVTNPKRSRDWYVKNLGFKVEFDRGEIIAIQDSAGFTIFLSKTKKSLASAKVTLTVQVGSVDAKYRELARKGVKFVNTPQTLFWGYGAELRDPDGYMINLWDRVSMRRSMRTSAA